MTNTSNTNQNTDHQIIDNEKKYALVKWLENSQFDVNNEWFGRLTSVPHSNIIDLDIDDLKVGMEISVFRNCGEIWRAQVIIPRTTSNDVSPPPPTSPHSTKQKTNKNIPKFNETLESIENSSCNFFTDFEDRTPSTPLLNPTLMLLTTPTTLSSPGLDVNNSTCKLNKELQFLQKAINDAGLTDFYQTSHTNDHLINLTNQQQQQQSQSPLLSSTCLKPSYNFMTSSTHEPTSNSIESVLKIQNELLEQQKELRSIEMETLEQLKLLQYNLNRLARKFDSFENIILNTTSNNNLMSTGLMNTNFLTTNNTLKMTKANLNNKLTTGSTIQQIKVVK
ncbi:unnamed protein product [Brachionus calyciflorus]|uniref:Uncharacterized protein n=1 Tax=Brachionus calyciflorus TaxID=104777 RepID=A0A813ZVZ5_9BILA|nr:unnamed protein product [Brachionus calyciflorus]